MLVITFLGATKCYQTEQKFIKHCKVSFFLSVLSDFSSVIDVVLLLLNHCSRNAHLAGNNNFKWFINPFKGTRARSSTRMHLISRLFNQQNCANKVIINKIKNSSTKNDNKNLFRLNSLKFHCVKVTAKTLLYFNLMLI